MKLNSLKRHPLFVALGLALAQPAIGQESCPPPAVNQSLGIEIPCVRHGSAYYAATLNHADNQWWVAAADTPQCQPDINTCAVLEADFSLHFPLVDILGLPYQAGLNFNQGVWPWPPLYYRPVNPDGESGKVHLRKIGAYRNPEAEFDESAAEIVAHDPVSQRLFLINAQAVSVDVLDLSDPTSPSKVTTLQAADLGGAANSVAVKNGVLAVAVEADVKQDPGKVVLYNAQSLERVNELTVGALPDMLTFTPDGGKIVVANEGEPNDDYTVDPEGSISIIDVATSTVMTADFRAYNGREAELRARGVRIFGNNGQSGAAQDLEPEYITLSADGSTAYVSLQENNALAVVDLENARVTDILPLGVKDFSQPGNELDASNKDDGINLASWPVYGFYQPDSIASLEFGGKTYILTANEGDARDYDGYSEETRIEDLTLDPQAFPNAAELQAEERLGRLKTTTANGDIDGDGDFDMLYAYGARSFSIWDHRGNLIFDSGNAFETITAEVLGGYFNTDFDETDLDEDGTDEIVHAGDDRSDDKGPEPEALTVGEINGEHYAFIGLERTHGIMVYNVSNPHVPRFVEYHNEVNYEGEVNMNDDLAPEGMVFIPVEQSPNGQPLLVVGNEVSGTVAVYQIEQPSSQMP